ncbi:hypothetical protein [Nocardia rhamnosiphila]
MSGPLQRCRQAVLEIARKGAQVSKKALRLVPVALSVVNLLGNEEAASWAQAVLAAFVNVWKS